MELKQKWQIGDKIYNRYEICKILYGGLSAVYICYDCISGSMLALKTLQSHVLSTKESMKLLEKEALLWVELGKHPYIVQAKFVQNLEDSLFIALEYIPPDRMGRNTLTHYMGALSFVSILELAMQLCNAMEHCYANGLAAHRDLKPDNIMITFNSHLKVSDFGLSKAIQEITKIDMPSQIDNNVNRFDDNHGISSICGTPPYMAPEQFDGTADIRSDIYSFGIILYQMISGGKLPFFIENTKIRNHEEYFKKYAELHKKELPLKLNSPLSYIVMKCIQKNPVERYSNFSDLYFEFQKEYSKETGKDYVFIPIEQINYTDLIGQGIAFNAIGLYEKAAECSDKIIKNYASLSPMALVMKAEAFFGLKNYANTIQCCQQVLCLDPYHELAWAYLSAAYAVLGQYDKSLECCDKLIQINPKSHEPWEVRGMVMEKLNRLQEALRNYEKSLEIFSRNAKVLFLIGNVFKKLQSFNDALLCYQKAIQIDSNNPEFWLAGGIILKDLHKYEEALRYLENALIRNPQFPGVWFHTGVVFSRQNRRKEAIQCYDNELEISPAIADVWWFKACELAVLNRTDEALACCNQVILINPDYVVAYFLKARIFIILKEYGDAIATCDKALSIDANLTDSWILKGEAFYQQKKNEKALLCFQRVLLLDPQNQNARIKVSKLQKIIDD